MLDRQCAYCQASNHSVDAKRCHACGALLPAAATQPVATTAAPHRANRSADRFKALAAHPDFQPALQHTPDTYGKIQAMKSQNAIVTVILVIAAVTMLPMCLTGIGAVIPIGLACFAYWLHKKAAEARDAFAKAPLQRRPAIVADERVSVTGGGENSRARTDYYISIEDEQGNRQEFNVTGELAGQLTEGDIGIAFIKGTHLLEFRRIPV